MSESANRSPASEGPDTESSLERATTGPPRWVKVLAVICAALIVLLVVAMFTGHGPGGHLSAPASSTTGGSSTTLQLAP